MVIDCENKSNHLQNSLFTTSVFTTSVFTTSLFTTSVFRGITHWRLSSRLHSCHQNWLESDTPAWVRGSQVSALPRIPSSVSERGSPHMAARQIVSFVNFIAKCYILVWFVFSSFLNAPSTTHKSKKIFPKLLKNTYQWQIYNKGFNTNHKNKRLT